MFFIKCDKSKVQDVIGKKYIYICIIHSHIHIYILIIASFYITLISVVLIKYFMFKIFFMLKIF